MDKGQFDTSAIVGIVVVLAVVSAVSFGVYYFGFARPRRKELEQVRTTSIQEISSTLGELDSSAAGKYKVQVRAADSKDEVASIMMEMHDEYEIEKKRQDLLQLARKATHGSFYTLDSLYSDLKSQINSKTSLSGLSSLESNIKSSAESQWEQLHLSKISSLSDSKELVLRKKNTPIYWKDGVTENEAKDAVRASTWRVLREMKFEKSGSYAIPIKDSFGRVPTVSPGSTVDIGLYDRQTENLLIIGEDSEVINVIYSKDTLGTISWSKSAGGASSSYSTNIWEEIKALEAGSGAASEVNDWGDKVVEKASKNNIGDFDLTAIYVVNVPSQGDAKYVSRFEQYKSSTHDIVILPQAEG